MKSDMFTVQIINKKATVLDLSACPGISAPLLTDLVSGENSIFRRVFGMVLHTFKSKICSHATDEILNNLSSFEVVIL
jgi:hypothetical protein